MKYLMILVLLAACQPQKPDFRAWTGRWSGPEGTYLEIEPGYNITIQNLDGPRKFKGTPTVGGLQFMRDGKIESIHTGIGTDTGMKWLADKKNCLVIRSGEGYCRD